MSEVTIYALEDPATGAVRYIGQTRNGLDARLYQHLVTRGGNATKTRVVEWRRDPSSASGDQDARGRYCGQRACG